MKLSEAMREGAKARPQAFGKVFMQVYDEQTCDDTLGSCALGAAYEGILPGVVESHRGSMLYLGTGTACNALEKELGLSFCACVTSPVTGQDHELDGVITDLNDRQGWTREKIADWLESIGY